MHSGCDFPIAVRNPALDITGVVSFPNMKGRKLLAAFAAACYAFVAVANAQMPPGDRLEVSHASTSPTSSSDSSPETSSANPVLQLAPSGIKSTPGSAEQPPGVGDALYKAMANYLASQRSFFVEIVSTSTVSSGAMNHVNGSLSRVWFRRPDHVVWTTQGDVGSSALALDGTNATLYLPSLSKYTVKPMTGPADSQLVAMAVPYGLLTASLFCSDTTQSLASALSGEIQLQPDQYVLGVACRHLVVPTRSGTVHLWVAAGDIPLPVRMVSRMTIQASPGQENSIDSQTEVSFRWKVNVDLPDATFRLNLPATALKVDQLGGPIMIAALKSGEGKSSKKSSKSSKSRSRSSHSESRSENRNQKFDLAYAPPPDLAGPFPYSSNPNAGASGNVPSLSGAPDDVVASTLKSSKPETVPSGASYQPAKSEAAPPPPSTAARAPDLKLHLLNGKTMSLSSLRGKAVVLDFWATWCGPCRQTMPVVAQVEQAYRNRGVEFFAVNMAEDAGTVQAFAKKNGLNIPIALDSEGRAASMFGVDGIPHLVVIGKNGTVTATHTGADPALGTSLTRDIDTALR
jgi:thiol-disulfide isomerase/thioredoxin